MDDDNNTPTINQQDAEEMILKILKDRDRPTIKEIADQIGIEINDVITVIENSGLKHAYQLEGTLIEKERESRGLEYEESTGILIPEEREDVCDHCKEIKKCDVFESLSPIDRKVHILCNECKKFLSKPIHIGIKTQYIIYGVNKLGEQWTEEVAWSETNALKARKSITDKYNGVI